MRENLINSTDALALYERGKEYAAKGDYDRAIEEFSTAIKIDTDYFKALFQRGIAYYKKGNYDKAIEDLEAVLKIEPNNAEVKQFLEKVRLIKAGIIGAIVGDLIVSCYKFKYSPLYAYDTLLTIATMDILNKKSESYGYKKAYREFVGGYPTRSLDSYWLFFGIEYELSEDEYEQNKPYNCLLGDGSVAKRVSPIAWAFDSLEVVLEEAKRSCEATHYHPEDIKCAQATAAAVYMARTGKSKQEIKDFISEKFCYNLDRTIDEIRPTNILNVTSQDRVSGAIIAFLESTDFENAIRLAISMESRTITCITGAISEAYYKKIPDHIARAVLGKLPLEFLEIIAKFSCLEEVRQAKAEAKK